MMDHFFTSVTKHENDQFLENYSCISFLLHIPFRRHSRQEVVGGNESRIFFSFNPGMIEKETFLDSIVDPQNPG